MMRGTGGVVVVALATLLVFCYGEPHQEQDVGVAEHVSGERYDGNGHQTGGLSLLGSGNLARNTRDIRHSSYLPYIVRRYEYNGKREPWPMAPVEYSGYYADGFPKRNFDEIDRSSLNTFVKKRNFDEIDRSSMPFPYATKRFYHLYGPNYLELDTPVSSLDKKRYRPDFPMDEIDVSFPHRLEEVSRLPYGSRYHLNIKNTY